MNKNVSKIVVALTMISLAAPMIVEAMPTTKVMCKQADALATLLKNAKAKSKNDFKQNLAERFFEKLESKKVSSKTLNKSLVNTSEAIDIEARNLGIIQLLDKQMYELVIMIVAAYNIAKDNDKKLTPMQEMIIQILNDRYDITGLQEVKVEGAVEADNNEDKMSAPAIVALTLLGAGVATGAGFLIAGAFDQGPCAVLFKK